MMFYIQFMFYCLETYKPEPRPSVTKIHFAIILRSHGHPTPPPPPTIPPGPVKGFSDGHRNATKQGGGGERGGGAALWPVWPTQDRRQRAHNVSGGGGDLTDCTLI
jgi:hypothetical protein